MFENELSYDEQLNIWAELIAIWRWSPDLFIEAITPVTEDGKRAGITLGADQKLLMRMWARFPFTFVVLPRGYGKTTLELLSLYVVAILTPGITLSMSSTSLENSAMLFKDKHEDICRFYPIIADEIVSCKMSVNSVEIEFKSGAKITNITTGSKSKGLRRIQITFEEAALTLSNKSEYADNIQPLTSEPYKSIKNNKPDPYVQTKESFVTTAYYKNDSYEFNLETLDKMINLDGGFVFGGSYELPCAFKRGKPKEVIESFEERVGTVFFNTNYRSRWIGVNENCIVDIQKMEKLRTIVKSELKSDGKSEYYLGVDVARSSKSSNNQTSIMVGKVKRDKKGKVQRVQIVYTTNLPQGLNFTQQSLYVKKIKKQFNARIVVVDANGLIFSSFM